eukprot:TRINITY_DN7654_c0_g1_i1.p1 TRINITY_DN7654_c0_g1~~TRINITY_DN7654_c0_g1_i1.p1  ORF type:complete len:507 (-),score=81.46 TRINITY_DN7654_c0_g1_i1:105-1625(-)
MLMLFRACDGLAKQRSKHLVLLISTSVFWARAIASSGHSGLLHSSQAGVLIRSEKGAIGQQVHVAVLANSRQEIQHVQPGKVEKGIEAVSDSQDDAIRSDLRDFVELNERLPKTRSKDASVTDDEDALATWFEKQLDAIHSDLRDFVELNEHLPRTRPKDASEADDEDALAAWVEKQLDAIRSDFRDFYELSEHLPKTRPKKASVAVDKDTLAARFEKPLGAIRSDLLDFVEDLPKTRSKDARVADNEDALAVRLEKLEEAAHIKLGNTQQEQFTFLKKPKQPDFFLRTVPDKAYRGLDDDLLASDPESIAKIFTYTSHRLVRKSCQTCAVVGGAAPLLKRDRPGHEIDEHDCVFRMNHGVSSYTPQEQPSVAGQKTTHYMFYCCWDHDESFRLAHRNAADWIFVPTWASGTSWAVSALEGGSMNHDMVFMDPRFITHVKDVASLSQKPLAGTLMLAAAIQICNSPADLYGFDTSDTLDYVAGSHQPIQDHKWIRHLDDEGAVRIH